MKVLPAAPLLLLALLPACQKKPDPAQLNAVAQYYVDEGGLALNASGSRTYARPCLNPVSLSQTLVGGAFALPGKLVQFIEANKLGTTTHTQRPSGYDAVRITPTPAYKDNWLGRGDYKSFCFGKYELVRAESVADAEPITAGASEPHLIPGVQARATRITFRLAGVPGGDFVQGLKDDPTLLARGSMAPDDYGRELTVVATLPTRIEDFNTDR
ncbi:hypothetical protein [Deinococcus planocerae]|uniref:hypothetical protein n=1 Tax=Deinococcus planocerae TaxID=1737569 RepID=UPI000C7ECED1|nr:hypothetical protein [Deinococcus planocerae]